jgi:hypothetical protein
MGVLPKCQKPSAADNSIRLNNQTTLDEKTSLLAQSVDSLRISIFYTFCTHNSKMFPGQFTFCGVQFYLFWCSLKNVPFSPEPLPGYAINFTIHPSTARFANPNHFIFPLFEEKK